MRVFLEQARSVRLGTMVSVYRGLYWHEGVVCGYSDDGEPLILSISAPGSRIETLTQFAGSQTTVDVQYPSQLPGWLVVRRAFWSARRPYHWRDWNCQHLVRFAHGSMLESPQVTAWFGVLLSAFTAAGIAKLAE
jgi:hypothetical protein